MFCCRHQDQEPGVRGQSDRGPDGSLRAAWRARHHVHHAQGKKGNNLQKSVSFPVCCSEKNVGAQRNVLKLNLSSIEFQVFMCLSPAGVLLPDPTREDHVGPAPPSQASE